MYGSEISGRGLDIKLEKFIFVVFLISLISFAQSSPLKNKNNRNFRFQLKFMSFFKKIYL